MDEYMKRAMEIDEVNRNALVDCMNEFYLRRASGPDVHVRYADRDNPGDTLIIRYNSIYAVVNVNANSVDATMRCIIDYVETGFCQGLLMEASEPPSWVQEYMEAQNMRNAIGA